MLVLYQCYVYDASMSMCDIWALSVKASAVIIIIKKHLE